MENKGKRENKNKRLLHWQNVTVYLILYDLIAVTASYFFALLLRFDFRFSMIPSAYFGPWKMFAPIYAVFCIIVFWRLRLYKSIWRFASFTELKRIAIATVITFAAHILGITVLMHFTGNIFSRMPISYFIMGICFQFILVTGVRFSYRFVLLLRSSRYGKDNDRVMLIGMHSIIGTT